MVTTRQDPVAVERGVQPLVDALVAAGGPSLAAVLFFGSRLLGSSPNIHSAADLFVVVDGYLSFYRSLTRNAGIRKQPRLLAVLNRCLAPNILAFNPQSGHGAGAKCFIMSRADLDRSLSNRALDYFCRGRLSQQVRIVHARSEDLRQEIEGWLERARDDSLAWVPLYLDGPFTPADYCLRMLEVSYRGEIRPESPDRVREVFESQRARLVAAYDEVLVRGKEDGRLVRVAGSYALARNPGLGERLRWRAFFRWSKLRATVRWVKYIATYDNWLDYIVRKAERRTGIQVELTPSERRFPFILAWPKVLRVLRAMRAAPPTSTDSPPGGKSP